MDRCKVTKDISQTEIPLAMAKSMHKIYDQVSTFSQQYLPEVSISWFHVMCGTIEWSPNVFSDDDGILRDWRGRVFDGKDLMPEIIDGLVRYSGSPLSNAYR